MEPLPEDVQATLLRGVAAYLRATPATELPSSLRRFQNFRPKGLSAHKRQLLDALDTDGFRALVAEWLDDKPALSKADASALRLAVERKDGWLEELASGSATKPVRARPEPDKSEAAQRDREKLRKAREEARKKLDEAQGETRALRRRVTELETLLQREERGRTALEKQLVAAQRATEKATAELERERRKNRSALDRAEAAATKVRAELKDLRRKLQSAQRALEKIEASPQPATTVRRKKPARVPGPRRALPVPKGRFEDDAATLEAWLGAEGVHLLVDGYNATMSRSGWANLDLAGQRQRLVDEVTKLARRKRVKATIVFDGSDVAGGIRQPRGPAKVHYSAADEIADDYLIGLLEGMPPLPVVVATSDRELQERAASLGATVANSEQLLTLLR